MNQKISWPSLFVALGIALGALGAHGLKPHLTVPQMDSFKTAVLYHLLMGVVLWAWENFKQEKGKNIFYKLLFTGATLFSFSIYLLVLLPVFTPLKSASFLGPITPIGGLIMISAWVYLGFKKLNQ